MRVWDVVHATQHAPRFAIVDISVIYCIPVVVAAVSLAGCTSSTLWRSAPLTSPVFARARQWSGQAVCTDVYTVRPPGAGALNLSRGGCSLVASRRLPVAFANPHTLCHGKRVVSLKRLNGMYVVHFQDQSIEDRAYMC